MSDYGSDIIQGIAGAGSFIEALAVTGQSVYQFVQDGLVFTGWDGESVTWFPEASWNWWMNPVFKAQEKKVLKLSSTIGGWLHGIIYFYLTIYTWQESDYQGTLETHIMPIQFTEANQVLYIDITSVIDAVLSGQVQEHVEIELQRYVRPELPSDLDSESINIFNIRTLTNDEADIAYANGWVQGWTYLGSV